MSMFNIVGLVALFFALLQPLHISPWVSWHSEVLAFLAVLSLAVGRLVATPKSDRSPLLLPMAAGPLFFLVGVVVVQTSAGAIVFLGDGLVILFYLSLCVMALAVRMDAQMIRGLAAVLLGAALCSALLAFTQALNVWETATWIVQLDGVRRPGANLGQPNQLATLLLMGLACLIYLFELRRVSALIAGAFTVLLLLGVAATESRTGWIGTSLLAIWLLVSKVKVGLRTPIVAVFGAFSGFVCAVWVWPKMVMFVYEGGAIHGVADQHVNVTAGSRAIVWPQIFDAAMQHPWLGWGVREVSRAHNAVLHAYEVGEPFTYAHSIVLELLIGLGFPMAIVLLLVVSVWSISRMRSVNTLTPWFCVAVVLPFAIHSLLEFPFAYAYFLVPIAMAVGALEQSIGEVHAYRVPRRAAVGVVAMSTALMFWSVLEYIQVEEDFRVVRFEALQVGKTQEDYERPDLVLLTQFAALLEVSRWQPQPNMSGERIELLRKVAMRFPWTATQNRYALTLALNGQSEEAKRQIKVMRAMHGEKTHKKLMRSWESLADSKYPELKVYIVP